MRKDFGQMVKIEKMKKLPGVDGDRKRRKQLSILRKGANGKPHIAARRPHNKVRCFSGAVGRHSVIGQARQGD